MRHARGYYQSLVAGGREEAVPPARGGGNFISKDKGVGVMARRLGQVTQCRGEVGPAGDSEVTTRWFGPSMGPLSSEL